MKNGLIFFLALTVVSCNGLKQGNFAKQKYTHLKSIEAKEDVVSSVDSKEESTLVSDSFITQEMGDYLNHENEQITQTNSTSEDENGAVEHLNQSSEVETQETKPANNIPKKLEIGNPRDFKLLSEEEQKKSLHQFNRLFNNGLILFLLAVLLAIGAFATFYLLFASAFLVFAMWIMSFFALNKLRRIDASTLNNGMVNKFRLAQFVCAVGVAVCVITLLGGLVLLGLWLLKVI